MKDDEVVLLELFEIPSNVTRSSRYAMSLSHHHHHALHKKTRSSFEISTSVHLTLPAVSNSLLISHVNFLHFCLF